MNNSPIRTAVIGIGGFAGAHHTALRSLEKAGRVKVLAAGDPMVSELTEQCIRHDFEGRGVAGYQDLAALLSACGSDLDLITVASPIHNHAGHHRSCIERGISCYLEKPPTLDPEELETMVALDSMATRSTQVGFNHIAQPWRQELKERILSGEFGRLRRVAFKGLWSRPASYYARNSWAGKLMLGDYMLLDSCLGNAMAHYVHNLLFHAGTDGLMSWASPACVKAELYRANAIESTDTMFVRGVLENGVELLLASTHACEPAFSHTEILECEEAKIEIPERGPGVIQRRGKKTEKFEAGAITVEENIRGYCEFLQEFSGRPATMLRDCQPFVQLNALLYIAAGTIRTIFPPHVIERRLCQDGEKTLCISGIEKICENFVQDGAFPSEAGVSWAFPGKREASMDDIGQLRPIAENLSKSGL